MSLQFLGSAQAASRSEGFVADSSRGSLFPVLGAVGILGSALGSPAPTHPRPTAWTTIRSRGRSSSWVGREWDLGQNHSSYFGHKTHGFGYSMRKSPSHHRCLESRGSGSTPLALLDSESANGFQSSSDRWVPCINLEPASRPAFSSEQCWVYHVEYHWCVGV